MKNLLLFFNHPSEPNTNWMSDTSQLPISLAILKHKNGRDAKFDNLTIFASAIFTCFP